MIYNIEATDKEFSKNIKEKIDNLTKPKGSLGMLEDIAHQLGLIQKTLEPSLKNPYHFVFAADHGIVDEGVSFSPKSVTREMVINFLEGGAGVNFLARQHNINLKIVDVGVDEDYSDVEDNSLIKLKTRRGTRNYLYESAMTKEEMECTLEAGAKCVADAYKTGCNIISFGEMGIGNTSSSSIWMHFLTNLPLEECVGAGSDHTGGIIEHKYKVLSKAVSNYLGTNTPFDVMQYFGGYELVAAVGAMLKAAELKMAIIIDGFIMTASALMASIINSNVLDYCIFGHEGDEIGHKHLLRSMKVEGILKLHLRLGEGTGALCAYPIIESSVRMINEMNSFKKINVTKYF